MRRKITEKLIEWKERKEKKPVLIYGARQVGKTYIIEDFAKKYYKNSIYINFEKMPVFISFFDSDISPSKLMSIFETHFNTKITAGETLIIFDEIQVCERALTSLKYFAEDAPNQHVIGAGSLLGVAINREKYSFPVGKVEMMTLYPLDFEEYLEALGKTHFVEIIKEHYGNMSPVSAIIHSELLNDYKTYLTVGGMPMAVKSFRDEKNYNNVSAALNSILNAYIADMAKYSDSNESVRIRGAYESIPAQLAKENKKFQYKLIRKGASATLFGSSIHWLEIAGVVLKCIKVERGEVPLPAFKDFSSFKLYMSDVGLYCAKALIPPENILSGNLPDVIKGAISENFVAQTLRTNGFELFYWESNYQAEVDFVIQKGTAVIPVEVKYETHTRSRSLNSFVQKYASPYSIRISSKNFGFENNIKSVPHYAAFCITPTDDTNFLAYLEQKSITIQDYNPK
ncbi:MAG: ATP-binding protein [bacterium]